MSDLLQFVDIGTESNIDTAVVDLAWHNHAEFVVPAANRRRVLDRERSRGHTPGPDGWLVSRRHVGAVLVDGNAFGVIEVIRIRWEPYSPPEPDSQDLDGDDGGER